MKELYISDLDGTLLNENIELSNTTVKGLNSLIEKGGYFSIATARTAASVLRIMDKVKLKLPIVLMNGAMIYDMKTSNYLRVATIKENDITFILDVLNQNNVTGFAYAVVDNKLETYYENLDSKYNRAFYEERVNKYNKKFIHVESFYGMSEQKISYLCLLDSEEHLKPVYQAVKDNPNLDFAYYEDIYEDNVWYLEIYSKKASKYNAVMWLREYIDVDKVIGFGDNLNDIPFFEACDESYAVANAREEVKQKATGIIGTNIEDGVIKQLNNMFA